MRLRQKKWARNLGQFTKILILWCMLISGIALVAERSQADGLKITQLIFFP